MTARGSSMRTNRLRPALLMAALALGASSVAVGTLTAQKAIATVPKVSAGKGTLYVGVFPDKFVMIDEATLKITGSIHYSSGIPRRTALSRDRTRFYTTEA